MVCIASRDDTVSTIDWREIEILVLGKILLATRFVAIDVLPGLRSVENQLIWTNSHHAAILRMQRPFHVGVISIPLLMRLEKIADFP